MINLSFYGLINRFYLRGIYMDNKKFNILVCDDEKSIVDAIEIYLKQEDYNILKAYDGEEALKVLENNEIHLVIMDIMMPKMDGLKAVVRIRETLNIPIIMVSAKSEDTDKIIGLNFGADDYITKPYNPTILLLRINAVFKRLGAKSDNTTTYRGMEILPHKGVIKYKDDEITLTKNEMTIFMYLLSHREHIVSRDELMTELWNNEEYLNDNALTVNISRLRGRFKDIGMEDVIETRKGQGYILV